MVFFWRLTGLEVVRNCFCSFPAISATDVRLIRLCSSIYFWGSLNKIPQAEWLKHWKLIFPYFLSLKVKSRDISGLVSFVTFLLGSWVLVLLACPYMVTPHCVLSVSYVLRSFSCKHTTHSRPGALSWPHFTLITPLQSCLQIWSRSEREGFSMWIWPSERHNSVPNRSTVENIPALKHLVNIQIKHPKGKVPGRCGDDRKKMNILEFHLALSIDFF